MLNRPQSAEWPKESWRQRLQTCVRAHGIRNKAIKWALTSVSATHALNISSRTSSGKLSKGCMMRTVPSKSSDHSCLTSASQFLAFSSKCMATSNLCICSTAVSLNCLRSLSSDPDGSALLSLRCGCTRGLLAVDVNGPFKGRPERHEAPFWRSPQAFLAAETYSELQCKNIDEKVMVDDGGPKAEVADCGLATPSLVAIHFRCRSVFALTRSLIAI